MQTPSPFIVFLTLDPVSPLAVSLGHGLPFDKKIEEGRRFSGRSPDPSVACSSQARGTSHIPQEIRPLAGPPPIVCASKIMLFFREKWPLSSRGCLELFRSAAN